MDTISYIQTRPNTTLKTQAKVWFGTSGAFSNTNTPFYEDNSFAKYQYQLSDNDRKLNSVTKAYRNAKGNVEDLRSCLHFSFIQKKQLLTVLQRKKRKQELNEISAVKIQKNIRGYLTRKRLQAEIVFLQQKTLKIRLQGLEKANKMFMFHLGKAPVAAALRIQNSARKYLFRCKIHKFLAYYNFLLQVRAEKIYSVIRKHLRCYSSKLLLKHEEFIIYRKKRLFEIRRNLAIATVSKIFKVLKLGFKNIKHRISRYKRRMRTTAAMSDFNNFGTLPLPLVANNSGIPNANMTFATNFQPYLSPSPSVGLLSHTGGHSNAELIAPQPLQIIEPTLEDKDDYNSSASENERQLREAYLKKLEELRKEKIISGKISYSIRQKPSSPPLLPFLYQKDIVEGLSLPSNYASITRACASRISESRPQRYSPSLPKSKTPTPQVVFISRRKISKPLPLYKKETFSYKMSRYDADADIEDPPPKIKSPLKQRLDSKLLESTFSHKQKVTLKHTEKFSEETYRPKTNFKNRSVPRTERKPTYTRPYTMGSGNILFNPSTLPI